MTPKQAARRARIEQAAYEVLGELGYNSASLLAIAKHARASNETLYNWYGNKQGLFRSLVASNAREAAELLERAAADKSDPIEVLAKLGPVLLGIVTGERAVMLNRAAAGDVSDTATLGKAIAEAGRETIAPLLRSLLERARDEGSIKCDDIAAAADTYFQLLIGDLQIRRAIGVVGPLSAREIGVRARRAQELFLKLYAA
ncbi:MAG: TetR/AcrR family transcriptional regulator [Rhizobiaceae bacterium]|nr:TetR/AcrR family transcriptional regulator [Rhizobiaceae bacterium]